MTRRRLAALTSAVATTAALLAVVTPSAATARSAPRPDLTVTSVTAPTTVRQGGTLAVTTVVRNAGRAAARSTSVRFVLSRDTRPGSDRALRAPTRAVPTLRPARTSRATTRITLPATTPVGTWYVLACADPGKRVRETRESNNCRASRRMTVTVLPSSQQLIEADVAAGRLTERQGLVYRLFADFRDPRLPARYAGRPNGSGEGALGELADQWGSLPAATQDVVRPFLIPPYYGGSHWSPRAGDGDTGATTSSPRRALDSPWCAGSTTLQPLFNTWDHLDSTGGDVRVWWLKKNPGDRLTALHFIDILENKILPALVTLMGRGPKGDGGGGLCDGGTDGLDIALVDATTATAFNNSTCGMSGASSRILFPRSAAAAGWKGADPYLAHEVMHTIQFAAPVAGGCGEYSWVREMTAEWVQDYVTDPAYGIGLGPDDTEFQAAPIYLDGPGVSLEVEDPPEDHAYGDYLLPFWTVRRSGPAFVKEVWDAAATLGSKEAVDAALPGGFEGSWADFALANWNRGPAKDYQTWDGLTAGAAVEGTIPVGPVKTQTAAVPVNHLATQYVEVTLDPKIEELEITNDLANHPTAKMRAVLTYSDGTHRVVDLSTRPSTVLCIDDGTKKVTQLVLIMSNADLDADVTFKPTFVPSQVCGCPNATPLPGRAGRAAPAPGPVCADVSLTYTWTEDWILDEGEERWGRGSRRHTGTLRLDLVPTPGEPGSFESSPSSTFTARQDSESEFFRNHTECDGKGTTVTQGSGALPAGNALANLVDDELWLPRFIAMPARADSTHDFCGSVTTDSQETALTPPQCPPTPGTNQPFYVFEPTAPDSDTFTFSCTGETTYEDGLGVHEVTVTVSGSITLPD